MKKWTKVLAIVALIAIIGFGMAACGNGDGDPSGGGTTSLSGTTWRFSSLFLSFSGSRYTVKMGESPYDSGTYTVSGNTITCTGGFDEDFATMTIIDENTIQDASGDYWTKVR